MNQHACRLLTAALFFQIASGQTSPAPANRIHLLNQELTRISSQPSRTAANHVRDLIKLRLAAFAELADTDPSTALSLALPESSLIPLRAMGTDIAANLESRGEWSGPMEAVVEDNFERGTSRKRHSLQVEGNWLAVHSTVDMPNVPSGARIRAAGLRMGQMIVATGLSVIADATALGCSSTGVQKMAVLIVNFASSSIDTSVVNSASLGAIISGGAHSVSSYWNEASYGQTSASGDVFGPYNLGSDYTATDYTTIQNSAINAAANTGHVNFQNYNHVVIIMPNGFPVGGGLGTIGCTGLTSPTTGNFTAGVVWLRADFVSANDVGVCGFAHENGHNMGLQHASTESYGSVPLGSFGTVPVHTEYGSYFSIMSACLTYNGTTLLGHYDAQHKVSLGWFAPANYQTVSSNGAFVLAPTENASSGLQAIRIQRGLDNNFWLWLEYRQAKGYDATFSALNSQIFSGAMIHFEDLTNAAYTGYTRLLNYTAPSHSDFSEPSLAVGSSWSDPYSLLTLNVTSADAAGLHVSVNYDTPCASLNPTSRNYTSSGAVTGDTVTLTASGSCSWTATANVSWISVTGASSGSGSGTVAYSLTANTTPSPRTGTITIARQEFTITQASSNPQPTPLSISPNNSSSAPNTSQTFNFVYSDANGASALTEVSALFGSSTSKSAACNIAWFKADNTIRLYDDAGDGGYSYWYANQSSHLANSQCAVDYSNAVATAGNNVNLTLSITFTSSFAGSKNIYLEAMDSLGADSGLQLLGTWSVGSATTPITITTIPANLSIIVDGVTLTAPQNFNWSVGSNHTISTPASQSGVAGTRYAWSGWSDSGTISHSITAPGTTTTYTATFTTQFLLTAAVVPGGAGSIAASPSSVDGYYNTGASVRLTAMANSGYSFSAYSGALTGGLNPQNVTMTAPRSLTANFVSTGSRAARSAFRDTVGSIRMTTYASNILSNSGGLFASDPSVAEDLSGNLFVTARDNFNSVWANVYSVGTSAWLGWHFGGGVIQGTPSLAVDNTGAAWIASRDTYNSYWLVSYASGIGFGNWISLLGIFSTDPVATACSDGSIYLIGKDNYNSLWSGHYIPGTGFQGWQFGGGIIKGKPAATCGSDNAVYVVAEDNYNSNWMARVAGDSWSGWSFGGAITSVTPRIAALGTGSLAVVILDSTNAVWRTTFTEGTGNGWHPWTPVGGILQDVSPAGINGQLEFAGKAPNGDLWWWQQNGNQWTWIGNNGVAAGLLAAAPR